jgi:hypothetical protein
MLSALLMNLVREAVSDPHATSGDGRNEATAMPALQNTRNPDRA